MQTTVLAAVFSHDGRAVFQSSLPLDPSRPPGTINREELSAMLAKLEVLKAAELERALATLRSDAAGHVRWRDFQRWMTTQPTPARLYPSSNVHHSRGEPRWASACCSR